MERACSLPAEGRTTRLDQGDGAIPNFHLSAVFFYETGIYSQRMLDVICRHVFVVYAVELSKFGAGTK